MSSLPNVPRRTKSGKLVRRSRDAASVERRRSLYSDETATDTQSEASSRNSIVGAPLLRSSTQPNLKALNQSSDRSQSTHSSQDGRRKSYVPTISSPLNPSKSASSLSTSGSNNSATHSPSGSGSNESAHAQDAAEPHQPLLDLGMPGGSTTTLLGQALQPRSMLGRPESPKYVWDLGKDYTRYPMSTSELSLISGTTTYSNHSRARLLGSAQPSSTSLPLKNAPPDSPESFINEKYDYPDDSLGAMHPYFGGEKGFILYPDEVESDDIWHNPMPDDDKQFKPQWRDYFGRTSTTSGFGGIILLLGLICVFIIVPILTFTGKTLDTQPPPPQATTESWAFVNNRTYPLLKNIRQGLIDPDTPTSAHTKTSAIDGSELKLVFSDEFRTNNRTFYPGDDPFWTAQDLWYGATADLEYYDPDAVTTFGDTLQLRMDKFNNHGVAYRSGMVNSWNQMCFKGGVFEVSVSLPGPGGIQGLWPGVWSMGNLGRPGYRASTDGLWPYSYNECDIGITPNQSDPDGLSFLPGQKLPSCTCPGADHPNPGTGRGAPEIDILEGSAVEGPNIGVITQSYQTAPFDILYMPNFDFLAIPNPSISAMNTYEGGTFQQAVSGQTILNNSWYDGVAFQKYGYEYIPGGPGVGQIVWYVGNDETFIMDGRAVGPNGNVGARIVTEEPMAMVMNLGMSFGWSGVNFPLLKFPTVMQIDYVRIYQHPNNITVTCDPPGYPTTEYIKNHPLAYTDSNLTIWDETGYPWPTNQLETKC